MTGRMTERALAAVALAAAASFLLGIADWRLPAAGKASSGGTAPSAGSRYHYGGGPASVPPADSACAGAGCHDAFSHRKTLSSSPFLNMHEGYVECLACHGKGREASWVAKAGTGGKGMRLGFGGAAEKGAQRHALLERPAGCRDCHSEKGRGELTARGARTFPRDFENPMPLRMIEGTVKRWVPESMR